MLLFLDGLPNFVFDLDTVSVFSGFGDTVEKSDCHPSDEDFSASTIFFFDKRCGALALSCSGPKFGDGVGSFPR